MIKGSIKELVIRSLLQFQPERIGIFGSYARGENDVNSDLDILISFKERISLLQLVKIEQQLSDELGVKVDLVTEKSLKNPRLKHSIDQDLIMIFNAEERPHLS